MTRPDPTVRLPPSGESDEIPARFSIVVASFSGPEPLARCLASITAQSGGAEVVVATELLHAAVEPLRLRFPNVTFIEAPCGTSVFRLRTLGVERATGGVVVLTEDHCTTVPQWLAELRGAIEEGHDIVGGPVDNGLERRIFDWSLYFCEYVWHTPPLRDGPADALSGVNVAYRRAVLESCRDVWRHSFYENQVHDALCRRGHVLHRASRAVVLSHLEMPLGAALRHLYGGGKRFGLYRQSQFSPFRRLLWIVAGLLVPFVLLARIATTLASRRPRRLGTLLVALPYVLFLVGAWSAGEAAGYLSASARRRGTPRLRLPGSDRP